MENQEFNNTTIIVPSDNSSMDLRKVSSGKEQHRKSMCDLLLDGERDFEDAEIYYPSKMNGNVEKQKVENKVVQPFFMPINELILPSVKLDSADIHVPSPFILANTIEVPLQHLKNDCIIPVFSKDNEKTIAHQEFIEVIMEAVNKVFPHHSISPAEIRVSHQIKGRTPDAIYLNAKELMDHQKTIYYERMAFIIRIPSVKDFINGNELSLTIGGVRAYNQENLYGKKTMEKFRFFIGFQNKVCCNMCVSTDGFLEDLRASTIEELQSKALEVMQNYNAELHLMEMKELTQEYLTEHQFAQLIGKSRLYQHLPKVEKQKIPLLNFNDSHINTIAKDYYDDQNFSRMEDGKINLWDVFNLFTQANKSSYIDTFLDRNLNAFEFSKGIQKALNGNSPYHWFLS